MTDKEYPPVHAPDSDTLEHPTAYLFPTTHLFDILDGGWIERYHIKGQRMLTRQSVAEHSWRMAAIIFSIRPNCSASLILATLFHDVSERVTGDLPANVKRVNPAIAATVNEVSTAEEVRLGIRFLLSPAEQKLLAWADRFEGALHCFDELEMGNRKIIHTLMRYINYCGDKAYVIENIQQENAKKKLLNDLQHQVTQFIGERNV